MATIIEQPISRSGAKKHAVKVDMTPMVDLGFLLITFFIFTTSLAEPTITKLSMPKESPHDVEVEKDKLLTILVDRQTSFVYEGAWEDAVVNNRVIRSNYNLQDGVGNIIRQKQARLQQENKRDDLLIAIKPLSSASYQDVMNALDEMQLNGVKRYGIMPITEPEKTFLLSAKQ